jgi:hypothetical protein
VPKEIDVEGDTLITPLAAPGTGDNLFGFINLCPNPAIGHVFSSRPVFFNRPPCFGIFARFGAVFGQKQAAVSPLFTSFLPL